MEYLRRNGRREEKLEMGEEENEGESEEGDILR